MSTYIHPLAFVDPEALLHPGVRIGPFAVVGSKVEIGQDTEVGAGAQIEGPTRIGRGNRIFSNSCIGFEPQDLSYRGEEVRLEIGDNNQFREFTTVHRGTVKGGGITRVGSNNLFMNYTHIAHDCQVGDRTVFANGATLAGHVEVHDDATISAFTSVHQFCRVGRHAYLGAYSILIMDALPFVKTFGAKPACYGLNKIGLKRKGFTAARMAILDRAYRLLVRSRLNTRQALARLRAELGGDADVDYIISFVETARRGVHKTPPRGRVEENGNGGGAAQAPQGAPEQLPQGAPGQAPQGAPGQLPQGAPGQLPQGAPGHLPEGAPGHLPEGAPGQALQGAPGQLPEGAPTQPPEGPDLPPDPEAR